MRARRPIANKTDLTGSLLLAHPTLTDPHFRHTVILVASHNSEGAVGVVLNRPLGRRLGDGEIKTQGDHSLEPLAKLPLYQGGPVQPKMLLFVAWQNGTEGLQLRFGLEPLQALQQRDAGWHLRTFLGYAGWTGGQLEDELQHDGWVVVNMVPDLARRTPDESLWRNILGGLGAEWRLLADEPDELGAN